jgi:peptide/nickel transport system ATP-binding protein
MPPVSLSVESISKTFRAQGKRSPARDVLKAVSFSVKPGETFGIMGESGSGKTALAKIAAGLENASSGAVKYSGQNIQSMSRPEHRDFRRRVQMVFQNPEASLNPRKTLLRSLNDVMHLMDVPRSRREEVIASRLEGVGLSTEILPRLPSQLSGGQNQRAALARTLLLEPEFLILDEPTSALDISARAHLLHLLKKLQRDQGLGYIFISHEPDIIRFMAHRVGRITDRTLRID